jgi:hypothetical protein
VRWFRHRQALRRSFRHRPCLSGHRRTPGGNRHPGAGAVGAPD